MLVAACALVVATPVARATEDTPGAAATGAVVVPPALQPLLEGGGEQVLARIAVPDEARQVGDVRLVRRNDAGADAVETILHTKLMRRVVAEIRQKEAPNWPGGSPGHEDSLRYLAALEAAQQELWAKVPRLDRNADQQQKLLIEFVLSPTAAVVVLSEPQLSGNDETLKITARRPMAVLDLSRAYIARNMRLIAADSFKKEGPALEELVAGLPVLSAEPK